MSGTCAGWSAVQRAPMMAQNCWKFKPAKRLRPNARALVIRYRPANYWMFLSSALLAYGRLAAISNA
jgi:hypothetical protein